MCVFVVDLTCVSSTKWCLMHHSLWFVFALMVPNLDKQDIGC